MRLTLTTCVQLISSNLSQGADRKPHVMPGASVHDDFEIASQGKTGHSDSGPLISRWGVVYQDVLVRRCIPNSTAIIVIVLEWRTSEVSNRRIGENLELFRIIRLLGFDPDVTLEAKCIGPEVFLIFSGRTQDFGEGTLGQRAAVLVFGNFSRYIVDLRDELAQEIGVPKVVVFVCSHAERPGSGRESRVVGELLRLVVELGDDIPSDLTEVELEI